MQPKPRTTGAVSSSRLLENVLDAVGNVILGKEQQIRLGLACLLARGHLLIEDLPGVGKTTLAHTLAGVLGFQFTRIQFTADLLPADILGVSVFEANGGGFVFHPGPIFAQLVLADEINRATPKTQSALLEAMEEHQVSTEGKTRKLPEPFFVIATQNPHHLVGTFPLPESQLDRFLMCVTLGFPDRTAERALLKGRDRRETLQSLQPVLDAEQLAMLQREAMRIHASEPLLDYLQNLIDVTRTSGDFAQGLSPRAALAWLAAARAWALLEGRDMVLPEDVQAVAVPVAAHRLAPAKEAAVGRVGLVEQLIKSVPIP
ncbi:MAG: AAA family ATPase [Gammaproteobacteria bacterium]|nr:AAA family ATPase [Gammaproteobacteria bacterium]